MTDQPPLTAIVLSVRRIWDRAPHNAFPDLIRYRNQWFCAFREGATHLSNDGKTRVISSTDGEHWNAEALLIASPALMELQNLCDTSLSEMPDGRLMLVAAAWHTGWPKPAPLMVHTVAWFSADGRQWEGPVKIGDPNICLWKVIWHKGQAFSAGKGVAAATRGQLHLYTSADGRQWEICVKQIYPIVAGIWPDESSLTFLPDDTMVCLTRRHYADTQRQNTDSWLCPAALGVSHPPYTEWQWRELGRPFAAPILLALPDGRLLAGGREWTGPNWGDQRWILCEEDPASAKLSVIGTLPSGGDSSYCGMVHRDGIIHVAYYSSHEGKTNLYFARLQISGNGSSHAR